MYGSIDWRFSCSFLTLIPKKEDSCTPKDFRPLSLISSAYKIISKLLAEMLKKVIPELISDFQGAFIHDKQILDGVLISNECVDSRLKSKKPIYWIRWCVTSSHISILVNGSSIEKFKPSKSLRQGDSLSPYLFLLVVEILSKLINDVVARGILSGFQVADKGSLISHLKFADDTLIFIDANVVEVRRLFIIFSVFETLAGLKVNMEKSTMISIGAEDVIVSIEKKMIQLMRNFVWGAVEGRKKLMWVGWKKICMPKTYSGLGIKSLRKTNQALLIKWIWRYSQKKNCLWRKIMCQKFKKNEEVLMPDVDNNSQCRSLWKNLVNMVPIIQRFSTFTVRNGKGIRFYKDKWLDRGCLHEISPVIFKVVKEKDATMRRCWVKMVGLALLTGL
ncbi:uncharacterized protein LOC113339540 [Papaver somniferum]|uniref:uncharacterized protein LOC113339540 n=1 Tax=Papaver somniferum TaxID=3469 RepID=UPI000E6FBC29|nr:uncharacterized protein LOC113339540 [Papaver somniferum]